jgi:hypothetical protein
MAGMKHLGQLAWGPLAIALVFANHDSNAQGSFQNLNFENATLPAIPPGGGFEPSSNAIPGWTGYLGENQTTSILHNDVTIGSANISILGPNYFPDNIIAGQYTVVLQSGASGPEYVLVDASIAQMGSVPTNALSLQFLIQATSSFSVSFAGNSLPVSVLSTAPNYRKYGADISQYSGQTGELRFTALSSQFTSLFLDSIAFSSQAVPEPSTLGLFTLGSLVLGWRLRCTRRP